MSSIISVEDQVDILAEKVDVLTDVIKELMSIVNTLTYDSEEYYSIQGSVSYIERMLRS